jgi:hypothetical protein
MMKKGSSQVDWTLLKNSGLQSHEGKQRKSFSTLGYLKYQANSKVCSETDPLNQLYPSTTYIT